MVRAPSKSTLFPAIDKDGYRSTTRVTVPALKAFAMST